MWESINIRRLLRESSTGGKATKICATGDQFRSQIRYQMSLSTNLQSQTPTQSTKRAAHQFMSTQICGWPHFMGHVSHILALLIVLMIGDSALWQFTLIGTKFQWIGRHQYGESISSKWLGFDLPLTVLLYPVSLSSRPLLWWRYWERHHNQSPWYVIHHDDNSWAKSNRDPSVNPFVLSCPYHSKFHSTFHSSLQRRLILIERDF